MGSVWQYHVETLVPVKGVENDGVVEGTKKGLISGHMIQTIYVPVLPSDLTIHPALRHRDAPSKMEGKS